MRFTAAFVAAVMLTLGAVRAEKSDFAKLSCDDLSNFSLEEVIVVGAWLSGYYNAKRDNTVVDSKQIEANTAKVMQYCRTNPRETVMHAIDLLSAAK